MAAPLHQTPNPSPFALVEHLENKFMLHGELVESSSSKTFDVINPATSEKICSMPECAGDDIDRTVASSIQAQKEWAAMDAPVRGRLLNECAQKLRQHTEALAKLMTLETGKALKTESLAEAGVFANTLEFYGGLALELKGETIPFNNQSLTMTVREPIGVVGAIIPWNVPLLLMALKIAPALVAGNSVIVKSAEQAPLAVLYAVELMNSILPPGVLNMISGDGPTAGASLVKHPGVDKVTFTGSVETGKIVYGDASQKLVPVTLELGGKSPMIVCEDMDVDKAVQGAITSMRFTRQGQSCTAASRIFVHKKLYKDFVKKLVSEVNTLKMGDPMDMNTDIGTIISKEQYDRVQSYIQIGKNDPAATAHECCELPTNPELQKGLFVNPTIFTGLDNDSQLCQEEIFGPVTCIMPWSDFDDVIELANDTEYGLAATIWTYDLPRAMQAVKQLDAGFVQVNQNTVVQPGLSYGGTKKSGLGKEASLEAMLEHFTTKKTIIIHTER